MMLFFTCVCTGKEGRGGSFGFDIAARSNGEGGQEIDNPEI